jgi:endoglucanase
LARNHIELADKILADMAIMAYRIALDRFEWGSNSDVLNQAMILCVAHDISKDKRYVLAAGELLDYIFGRNATGYCFLTGFGHQRVFFLHQRISGADDVEEPIPGFIVGGPNHDSQDHTEVGYSSEYPAKAYEDVQESYASNEVCINWNAPAVFVLGYLESVL